MDKKLRFPPLFVIFGRFSGNSGAHGKRNPWKKTPNGALRDFFKETARIWWSSDSKREKKARKEEIIIKKKENEPFKKGILSQKKENNPTKGK